MARLLFFDTETSGLPPRGASFEHPQLPRMVQLAAVLFDHDGTERACVSLVVRPDVAISEGASNIHGITHAVAADFGVTEKSAASLFLRLVGAADMLVAHNTPFDLLIVRGAVHRAQLAWLEKPSRCTMTASTAVINLPPTDRMLAAGYNKPKPPKLEEAYEHLCGRKMVGAHNALIDVRACIDVHAALGRLGVWKEAA